MLVMWPLHACHVTITCLSCDHYMLVMWLLDGLCMTIAFWSSYDHHMIITWLSCDHHVTVMPSLCDHVTVMPSLCDQHVTVMWSLSDHVTVMWSLSDHVTVRPWNVCLQLWDKRKTDYPTHRLTAHSGPVYNCEWHLERENCFATGGRDKNLKVRSHDCHVTSRCIMWPASPVNALKLALIVIGCVYEYHACVCHGLFVRCVFVIKTYVCHSCVCHGCVCHCCVIPCCLLLPVLSFQVFELQHDQIKETHSISTILPISRVNWRPSYKSQLGRCACQLSLLFMGFNVHRHTDAHVHRHTCTHICT